MNSNLLREQIKAIKIANTAGTPDKAGIDKALDLMTAEIDNAEPKTSEPVTATGKPFDGSAKTKAIGNVAGRPISAKRSATPNDPNYDADKAQFVVTYEDGTVATVDKTEVAT